MAISEDTIRLILDMGASGRNVKEVTAALQELENQAIETGISLEVAGTKATAATGQKTAGGQGILGLSYAVQDFTSVLSGGQGLARAFASVQNNIPNLITSLGAGAGLAGALSLVAVGVGIVYENWDKLATLWGKAGTAEEAERMKELAKATKEAADAAERMARTPQPWQVAAGKDVKRAAEAFGGEAVIKELMEALKALKGDFGPEAMRNMAKTLMANLMTGDPAAVRLLRELQLRGPVGKVLEGGPTPQEEMAKARAADERQRKEAEGFRKEREREQEQADKQEKVQREQQAREVFQADRETAKMIAETEARARQEMARTVPGGGRFDMRAALRQQRASDEERAAQQELQGMTGQQFDPAAAKAIIDQLQRKILNMQMALGGMVVDEMTWANMQANALQQVLMEARQRMAPARNGGRVN